MEEDISDFIKYDVIVIGGGIFGCLTAIELSKKGLLVQLHEKNDQIMTGASLIIKIDCILATTIPEI